MRVPEVSIVSLNMLQQTHVGVTQWALMASEVTALAERIAWFRDVLSAELELPKHARSARRSRSAESYGFALSH